MQRVAVIPFAVLVVCAFLAALDAAGPLAPHADGSMPLAEGAALGVGLVGMLLAAAAVFADGRVPALLPVAGFGFLLAHWLSFDGYYAPYRRRMSDGGLVSWGWIASLAAAALLAAAVRFRSRAAAPVAALVLVLELGTLFVAGAGH